MNYLDPYDVAGGSSTPPPNQTEQSLNDEVTQVIGQLGRFWGGFKKQSQTALEVARKDLTEVVSQAQKELHKFTGDASNETQPSSSPSAGSSEEPQPRSSSETLKPDATASSETEGSSTSATPNQTLFSRLQSSLPPNVVSTVQANLPESLKHISENTDFAQLRTTLTSEFQRLQGVTRTQAEEYVHKSEILLREAMKEAGEVLRDAVKVIPPDENTSGNTGLIWDGSDMWMLPSDSGDLSVNDKGKAHSQNAVATRAEALLRRLRSDPNILRHDPEVDGGVKEAYLEWITSNVDSHDGGVESTHWTAKIDESLKSEDGETLQSTFDNLVPSELSKDVFWKRYFFRMCQIQAEEDKRKTLLQGTMENEDDFSWEDDEADNGSASIVSKNTDTPRAQPSAPDTAVHKTSAPSSQIHTPATTSPRVSSEESYDVVSGNVSANGEGKEDEKKATEEESSDGDSDWE
ncbi:hypothetical protein J3R30DRAFT_3447298 [Lentinula aciculospora]|uniref:BSD domain-containing protein n=1 Tax=Lentinula aciculospora TaxID=153920 RepID=A0A9W9AJJ3_9AGAR|nr:hypothetical protein J3R30DRAFT_3447298 [Lentinula aciculospora]